MTDKNGLPVLPYYRQKPALPFETAAEVLDLLPRDNPVRVHAGLIYSALTMMQHALPSMQGELRAQLEHRVAGLIPGPSEVM